MIEAKKKIEKNQKLLIKKVENLLFNPNKHDEVFNKLQESWNYTSVFNLKKENVEYSKINSAATQRFIVSCPPNKKESISIGDGINWEWILLCASKFKKDIDIVSRDGDFGFHNKDGSKLNDYLLEEFDKNVKLKRRIDFTDQLSKAFKMIKIPTSSAMEVEEKNLVNLHKLRAYNNSLQ